MPSPPWVIGFLVAAVGCGTASSNTGTAGVGPDASTAGTDAGGGTDGGSVDAGHDGGSNDGGGPVLRTLHIGISGTGTIYVTGATSATCTQSCDIAVADEGSESLAATAAIGFSFSGWQGDCIGTGACSLMMTGDRTVGATFSATGLTFHLTLVVGGDGSGTITSSPPGITCSGGTCGADFPASINVVLTAAPGVGSNLAYWAGSCTPSSNTCAFTANIDRTVVADFEPPPPIRYSVIEIPSSQTPKSVNTKGDVVGWSGAFGNSNDGNGFWYDVATNRTLQLPPLNSGSQAYGINDALQIATTVLTHPNGENAARAMRIDSDGSLHDLGTLGGNTWAYGIDPMGRVVGWYVQTLASGSTQLRAFLHDGKQMDDLGSLDGTCSEAHAINGGGVIVGSSCRGAFRRAVIFRGGGAVEDLGSLIGTTEAGSEAWAVSASGIIAGTSVTTDAGHGLHGFVRSPGGPMKDAGTLPGGFCSLLFGVNDSGTAVGFSCLPRNDPFSHGDTEEFRAAAYVGGRLWDLVYMTGDNDLVLFEAFAINPAGWIVARGYRPSTTGEFAFLLVPR